jgi:hypothetical protein
MDALGNAFTKTKFGCDYFITQLIQHNANLFSAKYCCLFARQISLIALAGNVCRVCDFRLAFVTFYQYDELEILP